MFSSEAKLGIGDPLEYMITLASPPDHALPVRLHCMGKVVRCTRESEVAVTLERYEFVRASKRAPDALFALPLARI